MHARCLTAIVLLLLAPGCADDPPPVDEPMGTTLEMETGSDDSGTTGEPVPECAMGAAEQAVVLGNKPCAAGRFFLGGPAGVPIGDVDCAGGAPADGEPGVRPITVPTTDGDLPGIELFPPADGGTVVAAFGANLEQWACPIFAYSINCLHEEACDFRWRVTFHDDTGGFLEVNGDTPGPDVVREFLQVPKTNLEVQLAVTWPEDSQSLTSAVFVDPNFHEFLD